MAAPSITSILAQLYSQGNRQFQVLSQSRQTLDRAVARLQRLQAELIRAPMQVQATQIGYQAAQQQYQAQPTAPNFQLLQEARAALLEARGHLQEVRTGAMEARQHLSIARQQFTLSQQGLSGLTAAMTPAMRGIGMGMFPAALGAALQPGAGAFQSLTGFGGLGISAGLMAGGPFGMAVAAAGALATALGGSINKLMEWGDALLKSSFQFAEFSASMALIQAQFQIGQILLARERGERRASSTAQLAEARLNLARTLAPLEDAFANLMNKVLTPVVNGLNGLVKGFLAANPLLAALLNALNKDRPEGTGMEQFMKETGASQWFNQWGRPARFGNEAPPGRDQLPPTRFTS